MNAKPEGHVPYYRHDLALIHHRGFGFHAEACAPGILRLLTPLLEREGQIVVEIGAGSGLLTAFLVDAGHQVIATDASDAMLRLAGEHPSAPMEVRRLTLPDDPIPRADAIVGVGHALNYLDEERQVEQALVAIASALRPGGILAIDLCDLEWGAARANQPPQVRRGDDWVLITETATPAPNRYVRNMTTFLRQDDGTWRRDDERHDNILVDTSAVPALLARHGVEASIADSFGEEQLPAGLVAVVGRKHG